MLATALDLTRRVSAALRSGMRNQDREVASARIVVVVPLAGDGADVARMIRHELERA